MIYCGKNYNYNYSQLCNCNIAITSCNCTTHMLVSQTICVNMNFNEDLYYMKK